MPARNTATRDRDRAIIAIGEPPCYLQELGQCLFPGQPIDYQADALDPLSFTVDHIIPLDPAVDPAGLGGPDTLENKAAAHRACNREKSNKTQSQLYVTTRSWETP